MEFQVPAIYFVVAAPLIIVALTGMILMIIDLFAEGFLKKWAPLLTLIGLALAFVQVVLGWNNPTATFTPVGGDSMLVADNFATFLNIIFLLTGMLTVLISVNFLKRTGLDRPEFYMLMLFSLVGMMLMGMANDLILIFLALELLSIPLYIMAGMAWPRPESEESAMKYFLLGAFSSAIFVFGIALVYGATGTTSIPSIVEAGSESVGLFYAGIAMVLVGFGFKIAAVPFQMWTPDVYDGAPTAVTAFMSVGAKTAGFAALMRVLVVAFPEASDAWMPAIAILATLTLIVGNVAAIVQQNIKRMLGYSSIAHAGYILIAVAASATVSEGTSAALFYLFAYLFTNLGAFAIVIAMERELGQGVMLNDYKGLAKRNPGMALAMVFFMLSLTGIPLTGGFAAKFYVFSTAIEAGLIWLTIIAVIASVVSAFYYLRVVYLMYMYADESDGEAQFHAGWPLKTAVIITALTTFFLGIMPGWGWDFARDAVIQTAQTIVAGG